MSIYKKLNEMGLDIPPMPPKGGIYKPVVQVGNLLYISGQGATEKGIPVISGYVGADVSLEEGQKAARLCVLNALSCIEHYTGDLDKIKRVVKVLGFVQSASGFHDQPAVINGASALLRDLLGEDNGIGARSAVSCNELPGNTSVEIEFIFEITE